MLLYQLTRLYFIYSSSFVVPKISLHLFLLTGDHFSATHAAGPSVKIPVPLFEQHKHMVHPPRPTHSAPFGASRCWSGGVLESPPPLKLGNTFHGFLFFGHVEEVSQVLGVQIRHGMESVTWCCLGCWKIIELEAGRKGGWRRKVLSFHSLF